MGLRTWSPLLLTSLVCATVIFIVVVLKSADTYYEAAIVPRTYQQTRLIIENQYKTVIPVLIDRKLTQYHRPKGYVIRNVEENANFVTCSLYNIGELGNKMHQVAAVISIALENNLVPFYNDFGEFNGNYAKSKFDSDVISKALAGNWVTFKQKNSIYDPRVYSLSSKHPGKNIELLPHIQVFKYLKKYQNLIRQEFVFSQNVRDSVTEFFLKIEETHHIKILSRLWIGIHVRRGNMMESRWSKQGFTTPDVTYFKNAMDHMRSFLGDDLFFIVCGNDINWIRENILPLDTNIVISESNSPEVDMAILMSCNHVIMSVGTYGWWGAYLAGGKVVYYSKYPKPGSELAQKFNHSDVYPSHWVGIE